MRSPTVGNLDTLVSLINAVHPAVAAHGRRVSVYAVRLAAQYGLPGRMVETIRVGGLIHDIGKILVPRRLLSKPGRLNDREWEQLRNHPVLGVDLLERLGVDDDVAEIVLYHHERPDGQGYPDGLEAGAISWPVRIVGVMDAFDALTSPRAYRRALSVDAARSLIAREAGTRYCPWAVSGLLSLPTRLLKPAEAGPTASYIPDGHPTIGLNRATENWSATAL